MSTPISPLEQLEQQTRQGQDVPAPNAPSSSSLSPLEQLEQQTRQSSTTEGASPEEQQLLASNPSYKYLPKDPRFPNRQPGVYPMGPGNEWRNDPNSPMASNSQSPIDPQLLKHTAEGAGYGALAAGSALAAPFADPIITAVTAHLGKVKAVLDAARNIGLGELGFEGARKLYKEFAGDSKK